MRWKAPSVVILLCSHRKLSIYTSWQLVADLSSQAHCQCSRCRPFVKPLFQSAPECKNQSMLSIQTNVRSSFASILPQKVHDVLYCVYVLLRVCIILNGVTPVGWQQQKAYLLIAHYTRERVVIVWKTTVTLLLLWCSEEVIHKSARKVISCLKEGKKQHQMRRWRKNLLLRGTKTQA